MRAAEWIEISVFTFFAALAFVCEVLPGRRAKVLTITATGLSATLAGAFVIPLLLPPLAASVVRDWLPAALVLLVYWQAGAFFVRMNQQAQSRLNAFDRAVVPPIARWMNRSAAGAFVATYFELSYLFCYPMVPFSVGTLYVLRLGEYADYYWQVVLTATYISYAALPFIQTMPPRAFEEPWLEPLPASAIRRFNLWILRNASIHANTFPSAHVAASAASALVLTTLAPPIVATVFVILAIGIAFGTFMGRYHFAADAIAGAAVALLAFLIAG